MQAHSLYLQLDSYRKLFRYYTAMVHPQIVLGKPGILGAIDVLISQIPTSPHYCP